MNIDYNLMIAIIALGLSVYNFFFGRRVSALEKRTQVMSEVGEVHILYVELHEIYTELVERHKVIKVISSDKEQELSEAKEKLDETMQNVSKLFEEMNSSDDLSHLRLEKMRPLIQKIIRDGRPILENARELKKLVYTL